MNAVMSVARSYLGEGLAGVGLIHCLAAVTTYRDEFKAILNDGILGSVEIAGTGLRGEAFWFTVSGGSLIVTGLIVRSHLRATGTLPMTFSVALTTLATSIVVAMPASGAWMALAGGVLALMISAGMGRRSNSCGVLHRKHALKATHR